VAKEAGILSLTGQGEVAPEVTYSRRFEAKARYLASSLIVTIPVKVARELGIKLGDRVIVDIRRKRPSLAVVPQSRASPS